MVTHPGDGRTQGCLTAIYIAALAQMIACLRLVQQAGVRSPAG